MAGTISRQGRPQEFKKSKPESKPGNSVPLWFEGSKGRGWRSLCSQISTQSCPFKGGNARPAICPKSESGHTFCLVTFVLRGWKPHQTPPLDPYHMLVFLNQHTELIVGAPESFKVITLEGSSAYFFPQKDVGFVL